MARQVLAERRRPEVAVAVLTGWGLGPMAGQVHHFWLHADATDDYVIDRYERECRRRTRCKKASF